MKYDFKANQTTYETAGNLAIELIRFGDMIEHYKVVSGGHTWLDISRNGHTTNQKIWNFVSRFDISGLRK